MLQPVRHIAAVLWRADDGSRYVQLLQNEAAKKDKRNRICKDQIHILKIKIGFEALVMNPRHNSTSHDVAYRYNMFYFIQNA